MIVACPACSARYRIDKSKIKGRGAKITCPRCANKFIVYKEKESADVSELDFQTVGITWRVKKGLHIIQPFHTLAELQQLIADGKVDQQDTLSYDNRTWIPLHSVDNLDGFFSEIWKRAESGELKIAEEPEDDGPMDDDFDSPTMVIKDRDALFSQIRKEEEEKRRQEESPQNTGTPSPVYRTRGRTTRPKYLDTDPDEPQNKKQEVVGVHDPDHIKADAVKPPVLSQVPTEEVSNPDQKLWYALIVIVFVTILFAALVLFDLPLYFMPQQPNARPQKMPTISTPMERPSIPNHEINVPTKPFLNEVTTPKGSSTDTDKTPESDADSDKGTLKPPPTGEVDDILGD